MSNVSLSLALGDVVLLRDGRVLIVESQSGEDVSGIAFDKQVIPLDSLNVGEKITTTTAQVELVNDFEVAWISPARLAFKADGVEEWMLRSGAIRAAKRTGPGSRVVITIGAQSASIVSFGVDGKCLSVAYSRKQPPFVALRELFERVDLPRESHPEGLTASRTVLEEWIETGQHNIEQHDLDDGNLYAQLIREVFHNLSIDRSEERRWYDNATQRINTELLTYWLTLGWPCSAQVSSLLAKYSSRQNETPKLSMDFVIDKLASLCLMHNAETRANEVISAFEDFLYDTDVDLEEAIAKPVPSTAPVGTHTISFAQFDLPNESGKQINLIHRFLYTTAAHGFLEVENPLELDRDIEELSAFIENPPENSLTAIDGPGGTGKTTALMLRAAKEAASGRRVAFIVCSVALKNRLRRLQRRLPGQRGKRKTFLIMSADAVTQSGDSDLHRRRAAGDAREGLSKPGRGLGLKATTLKAALSGKTIGEELPFLIAAHQIKALVSAGQSAFETVFIDEAQDLLPQHWLLAFALLVETRNGEIAIPMQSRAYIAFDERQNILNRESILSPMIIQFLPNDTMKVATQRDKMQKHALSFNEALSLTGAIDKRFARDQTVVWIRLSEVVRQSMALVENAAEIIRDFETSHANLYGTLWNRPTFSKIVDRTSAPITSFVNVTNLDDLVATILREERTARRENALQLAVATPESWACDLRSTQNQSRWILGDLALRMYAAGSTPARTANLAIGFAASILRKIASTEDANGIEYNDFTVVQSKCGRVEVLVARDGRRGKKSLLYKKVLMRVALDAVLYRQSGPNHIILGVPYALKGFEFGTLISLADGSRAEAEKLSYTLSTRPRWKLITGTVEGMECPKVSGFASLCTAIMLAIGQDKLPVITPAGQNDLARGEGAAAELAELICKLIA
jgi:hypothetical protein